MGDISANSFELVLFVIAMILILSDKTDKKAYHNKVRLAMVLFLFGLIFGKTNNLSIILLSSAICAAYLIAMLPIEAIKNRAEAALR